MINAVQSGTAELPNPVKDLLNQAGVLDAVPYDGQPIIKDGTKLPLLTEPSLYQWGEDEGESHTPYVEDNPCRLARCLSAKTYS